MIKRNIFCPKCEKFYIYDLVFVKNENLTKTPLTIYCYADIDSFETVKVTCYHCKKRFILYRNSISVYLSIEKTGSDLIYKYPVNVKNNYYGVLKFIDSLGEEKNNTDTIQLRKNAIKQSDFVVVNFRNLHIDVMSDLIESYKLDKVVYIIDSNRRYRNDKWLKYLIPEDKVVFNKYEDCFKKIIPLLSFKKVRRKKKC